MKQTVFDSGGNLVSHTDDRTLTEAKASCIEDRRMDCRCAIQAAGLDEVTQLNAIAGIYPPKRCEAIKSYITACRNEYLRCKALILTAQTNDEADAVQFLAPPVPEGM